MEFLDGETLAPRLERGSCGRNGRSQYLAQRRMPSASWSIPPPLAGNSQSD
jgi:hypothetical protein